MPKVSIVMPVYNGEAYINEAIDSIIAQTFTDWEFIIVNEYGSNEAVTNILHDYEKKDSRIRVIQNETRLRIAESLNVGLRAATGEYIARMDADDIAGKERLAIQTAYMDQHPEIDICGLKVDMFGESTWEWNVYTDPVFLSCACLFYTPFVHPTIMMRAASLRKHQLEYNKDFFYTEDYEFFERASHVLQFTNLEIPETYFYRYLSTNATNVGGNQGLQLQNKVMAVAFERWGLHFSKDEIRILSPNTYPHALSVDEAQDLLEKLDLLLKEVFLCEALRKQFGIYTLFQVLHRRWMDAYESVRWRPEIMGDGQVQRAIDRGFFRREEFYTPRAQKTAETPRVSVVIPTYNSENYIMDTVWSILEQDYDQFEVLIMNEKGSEDRTKECIALFEDPRIRVIQNETKLGLAKSLNLGFQLAKGEYIARADADDVYPKDRLRKQVEFLDANPEIDVCGSWQRHFGKRNYIHKPPVSKEEMRANLIFKCEVCHSTVMLRRDKFAALDVIYDDRYLSEDYELWSRVANKMWFATIPEVLGEYRWNGENITAKKMDMLDIEAQKLVRRNLKQAIGIEIPDEDLILLSGWKNPFMDENQDQEDLRRREAALLDQIEEQNKKVKAVDEKAFSKVLDERRVWAGIQKESVVNRVSRAIEQKDSGGVLKKILKKLLKPLYRPFRIRYENRLISIQESVWRQDGILEDTLQTLHDVDGHLYDYYHDLEVKIQQQNTQIEALQRTLLTAGEVIAQTQKQQQTVGQMLQSLTTTVGMLEQQLRSELGQQADLTRQVLLDQLKSYIAESEKNILQVTDARVWKAEQLINETTDARVWKAEQLINETTDARVWKAEQLINETTDARVWKAESSIKDMSRMYSEDMYKIQKALCPSVCEQVEILFANDTWNTYHHGSSATSSAILKTLKETGKKVGVLPMPLLCENVQVFPRTVLDFESDEFFEIWLQRNPRLVDYIEKSKMIVINGEGCITQYCAGTLNLLYFAYIASKRFGKKCSIINHSLCVRNGMQTETEQDAVLNEAHFREIIRLVYSEIHFAALREKTSLKVLREILSGAGELSFDCISLYIRDSYIPTRSETRYITVSGGNALTDQDIDNLAAAVAELQSRFPDAKPCFLFSDVDMSDATKDRDTYRLLQEKCNLNIEFLAVRTTKEWLDCIFNSEAVITGRFHHSIAAYMLNRPFAAISPDIHKLQSALDMMECSENMVPNDLATDKFLDRVSGICESAKQEYPEKVKEHLLELALNNFKGALK